MKKLMIFLFISISYLAGCSNENHEHNEQSGHEHGDHSHTHEGDDHPHDDDESDHTPGDDDHKHIGGEHHEQEEFIFEGDSIKKQKHEHPEDHPHKH